MTTMSAAPDVFVGVHNAGCIHVRCAGLAQTPRSTPLSSPS